MLIPILLSLFLIHILTNLTHGSACFQQVLLIFECKEPLNLHPIHIIIDPIRTNLLNDWKHYIVSSIRFSKYRRELSKPRLYILL